MTVYVSTLHNPHHNVPLGDIHRANLFFDLLRGSLSNQFYKHLVPTEDDPGYLPWGKYAYTGIGTSGLDNLRFCCQQVIKDDVRGDFLEAGVWRGGAGIAMASVAKYYQQPRTTWMLDSFQGMPPLNPDCPHEVTDYSALTGLAVPLKDVLSAFQLFGVADRVVLVPGWLKDTLPGLAVKQLAVLRLDTDYYESTLLSLSSLYPLLSPGGWVVVDDYDCVPGAKTAVDQYRCEHGVVEQMYRMNPEIGMGVYWQKGR